MRLWVFWCVSAFGQVEIDQVAVAVERSSRDSADVVDNVAPIFVSDGMVELYHVSVGALVCVCVCAVVHSPSSFVEGSSPARRGDRGTVVGWSLLPRCCRLRRPPPSCPGRSGGPLREGVQRVRPRPVR